mgnify:CR=1 FL=1
MLWGIRFDLGTLLANVIGHQEQPPLTNTEGTHTVTNKHRLFFVPAGVLFGCILALGINSMAEDTELDSGPRAFPYNGILEFNGEPLNGEADLSFTLTDEGECNFAEEHDNVPVFNGRFSVNIGSVAGDVDGCVFDATAVYIEVGVREADSEGDYVALVGQQRIHPVPFAYWAAEGSDFKIDGDANVGGDVNVGGALSLTDDISDINGDVVINDGLTVNNAIQPRAGSNAIDWANNVFGGSGDDAWIKYYQDGDGEDTALQIGIGNDGVDNIEFYQNDAVRLNIANNNVAVSNALTVGSGLTVSGNADIRGNIFDNNGDVTISDNLDITGDIQDSNSDDLTINDGLIVTGDTTLEGQLTIEDISYSTNNRRGCMRIGVVQQCWGRVAASNSGTAVTFQKAFNNSNNVNVVITVQNPDVERVSHVASVTASTFIPFVTNKDGNLRTNDFDGIFYLATGLAGNQW